MKTTFILCLLLVSSALVAQFEDVEIKSTHLSGKVHMLEGRGGNLAVSVGEDGVFLVDDQYAPLTDRILAAIAELSGDPVSFVINTHWHGDHIGGNEQLGEMGAVLVSHDNVRARMAEDQDWRGRTVPASPEGALPVVTFNDRITFHINGETVTAYHASRAHTDGDSIVHFPESNVIHMGDVLFTGQYPFIDIESGGSVQGTIAAVQLGLGLCRTGTKVIAGHGPLTNCAGLETYGQLLADTMERIQELVDQGKSLDEIKAEKPTAATDEELGGGFISPEAFVESVYNSLN